MTGLRHLDQSDQASLIEQMTNLPSPPFVIARVLQITSGEDDSAEALASAIEADHGFTATVLRVSNSAFFGMSQRIYTVRDAIMLIGFDAVRSLAIAAAAVRGVWVDDTLFNRRQFWIHSLSCGLFAQMVAKRLQHSKPDAVFTLGVLHDIGRVIMLQSIPDGYRTVIQQVQQKRSYLWQAERDILGFHHGEIGARLAQKWNMPEGYSDAIEYHHDPDASPQESRLARILCLADALSHSSNPADGANRLIQPLYKAMWEPLGFDESAVRDVRSQALVVQTRTDDFYDTAILQ
jgi:putative nucleotidyltransferase with HDIG domain